jgi:hypothetical protein
LLAVLLAFTKEDSITQDGGGQLAYCCRLFEHCTLVNQNTAHQIGRIDEGDHTWPKVEGSNISKLATDAREEFETIVAESKNIPQQW